VATWIDTIAFPEPWVDLRRLRDRISERKLVSRLRHELRLEVSPEHELWNARWTVIGSGAPRRDDVLLRLKDGSVAMTHLTWTGSQESPPWPSTVRLTSLDQLREELIDRGYDDLL
jgi:hypothetical protein